MKRILGALLACLAGGAMTAPALGHGYVGERFFPPTITTDDPFSVDEFSLSATHFRQPGDDDGPDTEQLSGGFEFVKEIFPRLAVGVSDNYFRNHTAGQNDQYGWDNIGVSVKYELWQNDPHEAIISIGLDTDIGRTNTNGVGGNTTTFTPTLFYGKGFGDLPDCLAYLKPFAITGTIGQTFPTDASEPNALEWAFAVEYSLPYLQSHVRDLGVPVVKNLIPLMEFSFESPENRDGGVTTGTINPGVLLEMRTFQVGVEALIPINHESGDRVGVTMNLQIFIDDLLPKVFGHPIFGER
jgi:hypothetical protein